MSLKRSSVTGTISFLTGRSLRPGPRNEDQLLCQRVSTLKSLHWKDLTGHYGCVNAIEFSNGLGQYIASGGDDRRVLLWDVEKALSDIGRPSVMKGEHNSNIFCVAFDSNNKIAFSGGNDEQVIVHDLTTGETKDVFSHEDAVYGLSPDPTNPNMFASACDDGRILIYDIRDSCSDPFVLANYTSSMHSVMYNPVEPRLLVTANAKEGVGLWDVRKPRSCLLRYGGGLVQQSCMSVRFNQRGDYIIALRRRLPPVLYNIANHQPVCEFDHSGYYNSCTMKSICFAGDNDQYVLTGSDEFNLYMWALPDDLSERAYINSAHMVLKGHRSIVNQVRFNPSNHLIVSSGVEKIIKVWSPYKLPEAKPKDIRSRERRVYSHEEYINLVLHEGSVMSHDYSHESTDEDPRMMAFFDSLVQRELDGWSSNDSMSSNEEALFSRIVQLSQSDIDSDDSIPDLGQNDDTDPAYSPFTIAFASVMASQAAEGNDNFPRLNRALENAERLFADSTDNQDEVTSSEESVGNDQNDGSENINSAPTDGSTSHKDLTTLIKRKKQELRDAMKRRMKYSILETTDSDDSDDSSVSSLNIVIGEKGDDKMKKLDTCTSVKISGDNPVIENSKKAQIKLQRLKNLRKHVLNSDSEASDKEIHEKKLDSDVLSATSFDSVKKEGESEKVQFKKFKRRNTSSTVKSQAVEKDSKDVVKSRASPDLGPFLQKAGSSTSIEVRRASGLDQAEFRSGKFSGDSYSYKGKHKSKSSHRHSSRDESEKSERKHLPSSEHVYTSDRKVKQHSSHHKQERFYRERSRDGENNNRNCDKRDGGSYDSGKYKRSLEKDLKHDRDRDHHRCQEGEQLSKGRYSRSDKVKRDCHDRKYREHRRESPEDRHDDGVKHDCRKDKAITSKRHAGESKDHCGKDGSHKHVDRGKEKHGNRHHRSVESESHTDLNFEEKSFNFYMEKDGKYKQSDIDQLTNSGVSENGFKPYRKDTGSDNNGCSEIKKLKLGSHHQRSSKSTEENVDDNITKKSRNARICDKNHSKIAKGKTVSESGEQKSSLYCNGCAKVEDVEDRPSTFSEHVKDGKRRESVHHACSINKTNSENAEMDTIKDRGNSERKTNSKSENDKKLYDQKPSCSYSINDSETVKHSDKKSFKDKMSANNHGNIDDESETSDLDSDENDDENDKKLKVKDSKKADEDQSTWLEFKRFKNRLERARKRYTKEKHHRKNERRWSDEK